MKISFVFIFVFVLFNVLEQRNTKYLLVEVEGKASTEIEGDYNEDISTTATLSNLCKDKKCGDVCDTSHGLLTVMRYCQPDLTCGTNSMPECDEIPTKNNGTMTMIDKIPKCMKFGSMIFGALCMLADVGSGPIGNKDRKAKLGEQCEFRPNVSDVSELPDCEEGLHCLPPLWGHLVPLGAGSCVKKRKQMARSVENVTQEIEYCGTIHYHGKPIVCGVCTFGQCYQEESDQCGTCDTKGPPPSEAAPSTAPRSLAPTSLPIYPHFGIPVHITSLPFTTSPDPIAAPTSAAVLPPLPPASLPKTFFNTSCCRESGVEEQCIGHCMGDIANLTTLTLDNLTLSNSCQRFVDNITDCIVPEFYDTGDNETSCFDECLAKGNGVPTARHATMAQWCATLCSEELAQTQDVPISGPIGPILPGGTLPILPLGTIFRQKQDKCAKWKRKGKLEKQCRKLKHRNLQCCKQRGHDAGPENRRNGAGSNIQCTEKPKKVQECKKKLANWIKKGKIEKKCNELISKYEKKKGKKPKMKKCVCSCLKRKQEGGNPNGHGEGAGEGGDSGEPGGDTGEPGGDSGEPGGDSGEPGGDPEENGSDEDNEEDNPIDDNDYGYPL